LVRAGASAGAETIWRLEVAPKQLGSFWRNMVTSSGMYSLAIVGQRLLSLATLMIYTRFLRPSDYGLLDLLENISSLTSVLLGSSFASTLFYIYGKQRSEQGHRAALSTNVLGAGIIGLFASLLGLAATPWLDRWLFDGPAPHPYFQLIFIGLGISFVIEALFAWLRSTNATQLFLIASLGRTVIGVCISFTLLAYFKLEALGVVWSSLVSAVLAVAVLGWLFRQRVGLFFDRNLFVEMLRITVPQTLGALAQFTIHFGDRFFLKNYTSLEAIGIYSLAYKLAMLLSVAYSSFQSYWVTQVVNLAKQESGMQLIGRTLTYLLATLTAVGLGLVVLSKPVIRSFASPSYLDAIAFIPILVLCYFIRSIGDFLRCLFLVLGTPGVDSMVNVIGAAVCIVGYATLIPKYGALGAAVATLATFSLILLGLIIWMYRNLPFPVEWVRLGQIGLASSTSLVANMLIPEMKGLQMWGISLFCLGLYPVALFGAGFFTEREREWLALYISRRVKP
jgi:O-antigen/teichoic acid export membrane protein